MKNKILQVTEPTVNSHDLLLIDYLHHLFSSEDHISLHFRLSHCLNYTRTLAHARSLHSWVVNAHDLAFLNLQNIDFAADTVMIHWKQMVCDQIVRILEFSDLKSVPEVWRALFNLSPSDQPVSLAVQRTWDAIYCRKKRMPRSILAMARYGDPQRNIFVHDEVLQIAGVSV